MLLDAFERMPADVLASGRKKHAFISGELALRSPQPNAVERPSAGFPRRIRFAKRAIRAIALWLLREFSPGTALQAYAKNRPATVHVKRPIGSTILIRLIEMLAVGTTLVLKIPVSVVRFRPGHQGHPTNANPCRLALSFLGF
jgi:hypothetical protein